MTAGKKEYVAIPNSYTAIFVGRALKITQIPSSRWNMSRHFVSFTVVPLDFARSRPYEAVLAIMRLLPARPRKDAKCRDIFHREDGI